MTTMWFEVVSDCIIQPLEVGIREDPKRREYWYIQRFFPLIESGGSSSRRRARMKRRDDVVRVAARCTWDAQNGVGSSSRRKKGLRFKTTGES